VFDEAWLRSGQRGAMFMKQSAKPRGVIVPLVTPFTVADELDEAALRRLVNFLIESGVHGLFPGGTTAEGPLLTAAERQQMAATVVEATNGRVPIIVQVGCISTRETIAMAQHARSIGADAVAVLTPFYYRLSEAALRAHYARVCEAIPDVPVYLYNIPQRTGNDLTPRLAAEIAEQCPNVVGIKESSGNLNAVIDILALCPRLHVILGNDGLILPAHTMGVQASVSGNANVFPELFVALFEAIWSGDMAAARVAQERVNVVVRILKDGADLSLFKAVLTKRGLPVGGVRLPRLNAPESEVNACVEALAAAGIAVTEVAM